jgi:hypothetical protein
VIGPTFLKFIYCGLLRIIVERKFHFSLVLGLADSEKHPSNQ